MVQVKRTMPVGRTLMCVGGSTMPAAGIPIFEAAVAAAFLMTILLSGYMVAVG